MSIAMNGKNFESQLVAASVKLARSLQKGYDPVSGFSTGEITQFLIDLPQLGNDDQIAKVKGALRRNGLVKEAESFAV